MRRGALALALALALPAQAQITADGTAGSSVALSGPSYSITAGTQVGGNLFHSFSQFSLVTGQSATFSGAPSVQNIVSRVTGGGASSIDGTVRSTIAGANLFLVNPSGIAFGPNARLDVGGSFHASTASYLKLGASGRFDAANPDASVLTVDAPSAFGFLGAPAGISVDRSQLRVTNATLSLVGGSLSIAGTAPFVRAPASASAPTLWAAGGRVNLASLASAGEVELQAGGIGLTSGASTGAIEVSNATVLTEAQVAGQVPGPIYVRGARLALRDSAFSTLHAVTAPSANVDLTLDGAFDMAGGIVRASSPTSAAAGDVTIRAASVSLSRGLDYAGIDTSAIDTVTFTSGGRAGKTTIEASGEVALSGGSLLSSITFFGTGAASGGDTRISAPALTIAEGSSINVETFGDGAAGRVVVDVGNLVVSGGGRILAGSEFDTGTIPGSGAGGSITVNASNSVSLAGTGSGLFSVTTTLGPGGSISVSSPDVRIADGAEISAKSLADHSTAATAGSIAISGGRLALESGGRISVQTFGNAAAGRVDVNVQDLFLAGGGQISAGTVFDPALPPEWSSGALTSGPGGDLVIRAAGAIDIRGADSGLFSDTRSKGPGGSIAASAGSIQIANGGRISTVSANPPGGTAGNAGSISLAAGGRIVLTGGGAITTESEGAGGGRIVIQAGELLALDASRITTSVRVGGGNGGDILIDPIFVTLNSSDIIARAIDGNGGNIFIVTQYLLQSPDSSIDATSQRGISGSVTISAPDSDVGSRLVALPSAYVDAASRLRESCAARAERPGNSFVGLGRGGLPASPEAAAFAGYGFAPSRAAELTIRAASCPGPRTG